MHYYESAKGIELEDCIFSFTRLNRPNTFTLLSLSNKKGNACYAYTFEELEELFKNKEVVVRFQERNKRNRYTYKSSTFKTKKRFINKVKNNRK